jgi:ABC-type proline/glycine betaine transport system substrate-binding protein
MARTSKLEPQRRSRISRMALGAALLLGAAQMTAQAEETAKPTPVKLAVFDFELEDSSPTAVLQGQTLSSADDDLRKVTSAARTALAQSGRYVLVDVSKVDAKAATEKSLRKCNGCEADIAHQLGAEQSLLGVVIRATQTDYYLLIQIRDARTGKILDQESANFAGGEEGWPSGVRMLIKHQVLVTPP